MDYVTIIIIVTLVTSFLGGLVLGKLLEMRPMEQFIIGNFFLFLTALTIDVIVTFTGYKF